MLFAEYTLITFWFVVASNATYDAEEACMLISHSFPSEFVLQWHSDAVHAPFPLQTLGSVELSPKHVDAPVVEVGVEVGDAVEVDPVVVVGVAVVVVGATVVGVAVVVMDVTVGVVVVVGVGVAVVVSAIVVVGVAVVVVGASVVVVDAVVVVAVGVGVAEGAGVLYTFVASNKYPDVPPLNPLSALAPPTICVI
jgi:hypothetical protein